MQPSCDEPDALHHKRIFDLTDHGIAGPADRSAGAEKEEYAERLREFARHVQDAREEQNRAIAGELHDELGQLLTVIEMNLGHIEKETEALHGEDARDRLQKSIRETRAVLKRAIDTTRRVVGDLYPALLETVGLLPAIEVLIDQMNKSTNTLIELVQSADMSGLDHYQSLVVYRFVQEALTNVVRHGGASHTEVSIRSNSRILTIEVVDDGVGFDPDALGKKHAFGLLHMQERARSISARVAIDSIPGSGTHLVLIVPETP